MNNFLMAPYSTIEIVSLYRGSRKVNRVSEVNWGCEFKIKKGPLFDSRNCVPVPRKLKINSVAEVN